MRRSKGREMSANVAELLEHCRVRTQKLVRELPDKADPPWLALRFVGFKSAFEAADDAFPLLSKERERSAWALASAPTRLQPSLRL